jgi:hypothetical protein
VPVPYEAKGATAKGWNETEVTAENLDQHFPLDKPWNIGLLLGAPSGGLVDVDLDAPEALAAADLLLPGTERIHGRPGNPRSHRWYVVDDPPAKATTPFKDLKGAVLVEVRSTGGQTLVPPSTHPSREQYVWDAEAEPTRLNTTDLLAGAGKVAAAALLARHWPREGGRQDAALALAGGLARAGWSPGAVETFIRAVATAAGDEETSKRADVVPRTSERVVGDQPVTGWPTLAGAVGEDVVLRVCQWLGVGEPTAGRDPEPPPQRIASRLVALVGDAGAEVFRDSRHIAYVSWRVGGHRETWPLNSLQFRQWLAQEAFRAFGNPAGNQQIDEAVSVLGGRALVSAAVRDVFVRVADHEGRVYLDLADEGWRAVEIDRDGWRVVDTPPVRFRRPKGMQPLPEPVPGGRVDELFDLLNLGGGPNRMKVVAWLLGTLQPAGPYPVLVLHGEQGSAKSTTAEGLCHLVDPRRPSLRAAPGSEQDLALAAANGWVVAFDNLSDVRPWLSDALCRLTTGGGFSTRMLFTNDDEFLLSVTRPVLLNGIAPEMVSRPDLLDRSLVVELPAISDEGRRTKGEVWGRLNAARPRLLGALLSAVSLGLRCQAEVQLERLPRMADFAKWVEACAPALGWKPGEFVEFCLNEREEQDAQALAAWPVMPALERLVQAAGVIEVTVAELLAGLRTVADTPLPTEWPRTAKGLGAALRRYAPALKRVGIRVERLGKGRDGHRVRLTWVGTRAPGPPTPLPPEAA